MQLNKKTNFLYTYSILFYPSNNIGNRVKDKKFKVRLIIGNTIIVANQF